MSPNILVVDDSATARNVLRRHLANLKMDSIEAEDATHALQLLHQVPVSLVIADINMPGMDGIDFLRELRTNAPPPLCDIPVVLITGEKGGDLRQRGLEAGANAVLLKPATRESIRAAVTRLLTDAV